MGLGKTVTRRRRKCAHDIFKASLLKLMNSSASPALPTDSPRKKILVVDDDNAVRTGLAAVLVAEGYDVVTASNGVQALAVLRREPCDLALLDMNMPLLNGWGTIGELRRLNRWLPIIIITARPDQGTLACEAGVALMEKPLDPAGLFRRIDELLQPLRVVSSVAPKTGSGGPDDASKTPVFLPR